MVNGVSGVVGRIVSSSVNNSASDFVGISVSGILNSHASGRACSSCSCSVSSSVVIIRGINGSGNEDGSRAISRVVVRAAVWAAA